jgi:hypothetical protein
MARRLPTPGVSDQLSGGGSCPLAAIVENETELTAYDPQVERPLRETSPQGPAELMSRITEDLRSRYGS